MSGAVELAADGAQHLPATTGSAEARVLLAHVLGCSVGDLLLRDQVPPGAVRRFADLIARRARGVPLQHLTGVAHFRHSTVRVGPGVFIPRPETEVMVGHVIAHLQASVEPTRDAVVVDLCTGSGVIARALIDEVPGITVHACDIDETALGYAAANLDRTGVDLRREDLAGAFRDLDHGVDVVVCNPPYIPLQAWESVDPQARDHDPATALFSGQDGLDATRALAVTAARLLRRGGLVAAEHAEVQRHSAVSVFVDQGQWHRVADHRDLTGRPRFVTARRR